VDSVDEKLELFTKGLNEYHTDGTFFNYFLNQISVDFYPTLPPDFQLADVLKKINNEKVL